ncbi:MAG: response regulator transcription factor [Pseudomonadota bacterium]
MSIRVLLTDDHEVVRAGYARLLESTPGIDVIAEASSGEEACSEYFNHQPDVLVMDLTMPGIGGLEACRRILARDTKARILVFSVHENEIMLERALNAGVKGYISKRSASEVMVDAVQQVAAGEVYIGQEMMPHLVGRGASTNGGQIKGLTPREFEVFRLLADSKSVSEIAGILNISPKTVGHHMTHIKEKLGTSNIAGLTRLAIRLGITNA